MERTIKAGARQYEAFAGKVVYMDDYEAPELDKETEATYDAFRFKGFDMLPIGSFVVQTGKALNDNPALNRDDDAGNLTLWNNVRKYKHECGALTIPHIIMYNEDKKCYYGLEYIGYNEDHHNGYKLAKYDANGRFTGSRLVDIDKEHKITDESTCSKGVHEFVYEMISEYEKNGHQMQSRPYIAIVGNQYKYIKMKPVVEAVRILGDTTVKLVRQKVSDTSYKETKYTHDDRNSKWVFDSEYTESCANVDKEFMCCVAYRGFEYL